VAGEICRTSFQRPANLSRKLLFFVFIIY